MFVGQEDMCSDITTTNILTGDFTCPPGFQKAILNSGSKTTTERTERSCGLFWLETCYDVTQYVSTADYNAFWCFSNEKSTEYNLLFGGLFTPYHANLWTQSTNCPPFYIKVTLLDYLTICVSQDIQLGSQNSLDFGGFFGCQEGNPFAVRPNYTSSYRYFQGCPHGFSQHLANIDDGCMISYCVKSNKITSLKLPQIQLPPYMSMPGDTSDKTRVDQVGITREGEVVDLREIDTPHTKTNEKNGMVSSHSSSETSGGRICRMHAAVILLMYFSGSCSFTYNV